LIFLFLVVGILTCIFCYIGYNIHSNDPREDIGIEISDLQQAERFIRKQTIDPNRALFVTGRTNQGIFVEKPVGHLKFARRKFVQRKKKKTKKS